MRYDLSFYFRDASQSLTILASRQEKLLQSAGRLLLRIPKSKATLEHGLLCFLPVDACTNVQSSFPASIEIFEFRRVL